MSIFGNKVAEIGADALILSLTTFDELKENPKGKKDKEWYVHCRNRVLTELKTQIADHPEMKQHILTIETFFEELGGKKEQEISTLGWSQIPQKIIESQIVKSIVKSLKQKDEADEETRDAIIARAREIAPESVIKRMKDLFSRLRGEEEPVSNADLKPMWETNWKENEDPLLCSSPFVAS